MSVLSKSLCKGKTAKQFVFRQLHLPTNVCGTKVKRLATGTTLTSFVVTLGRFTLYSLSEKSYCVNKY